MHSLEFDSRKRERRLGKIFLTTALTAIATLASLAAFSSRAQSQSQSAGAAPRPYTWDVVSVKPSTGAGRGGSSNMPDGFSMHGGVLTGLIFSAYGLKYPEQLVGAPGWLASDKFDVDVKMDSSVMDELDKMSPDDRLAARHQMTQALLADRFKLVIHHETRELQVYTLTIAKSGLKMKEAKAGDTYPNGFKGIGGSGGGGMLFQAAPSGVMITAQGAPLSVFIPTISRELNRIVLDKTGLTGNYDFTFQYTPENFRPRTDLTEPSPSSGMVLPPDFGVISIFTAVQEQLGLKLESVKAPIDVIVIDHMERPSGN
jgi:uncharacterized protein (TIGR03435 family)